MFSMWVTIPTARDWPSLAELTKRDAVVEKLTVAGIGTCTGAGGGCGEMDFSFRVGDEQSARAAIELAMQTQMPDVTYNIRVSV